MLTFPGHSHFFLCQHPVNMRKSFEGLSIIIEKLFPDELFSGAFFVFLNRRKDHMKVLFWDGDGFVIWFKRLERGTFSWTWGSQITLDRRRFLLLLEGIVPKRMQKRFSLTTPKK